MKDCNAFHRMKEPLACSSGGSTAQNSGGGNASCTTDLKLTEKNALQNALYWRRRGSAVQHNSPTRDNNDSNEDYAEIVSEPLYEYAVISARSSHPGQFVTAKKGDSVELPREGVAIPKLGASPKIRAAEGIMECTNQASLPRQIFALPTQPAGGLVPAMDVENPSTGNYFCLQLESDDYAYNTLMGT